MTRTLSILILIVCLGACTPAAQRSEGVAIYLPAQPLSGREMLAADLGALALQPEPIVAAEEILSYSASSHDLELAPAAISRLAALKVPVQGQGFVICDGATRLLAGAFWTPISSLSFEGLTINVPFGSNETRLHLYTGYPMQDAPMPDDPRDNPQLLDGFRQAGKLR